VANWVSVFYFLSVVYVLGLLGLPLALGAVSQPSETFAYFAGILATLSLIDLAISIIAMINATGASQRSHSFNIVLDAGLAGAYASVAYLIAIGTLSDPFKVIYILIGIYVADFLLGTYVDRFVVGANDHRPE